MAIKDSEQALKEQLRVCVNGGKVIFEAQFKEHRLYSSAATKRYNIPYEFNGYAATDEIEKESINEKIGFLFTTTYEELFEFAVSNQAKIIDIMPHSFFINNAFIEGNLNPNQIDELRPLLRGLPLQSNSMVAEVMQIYENKVISRMPYWLTRRAIIVLEKI